MYDGAGLLWLLHVSNIRQREVLGMIEERGDLDTGDGPVVSITRMV